MKKIIFVCLVYFLQCCSSNKTIINTSSGSIPKTTDEIYQTDIQTGSLRKLEVTKSSFSSIDENVIIIGGGGTSKEFLTLSPNFSSVRLTSQNAKNFVVKTTDKYDIRLYKLTKNDQKRLLHFATRSLSFLHGPAKNEAKKYRCKISISKLSQGLYIIKPKNPLEPGSYAFIFFGKDLDACIKDFLPNASLYLNAFDIY